MSKLEIVRSLSDASQRREAVQTVADLQAVVHHLAETLQSSSRAHQQQTAQAITALTQLVRGAQESARQQSLDLAVLLEPIAPALEAIQTALQEQDARLKTIETTLSRVVAALPSLKPKDGKQVQPKLASSTEVSEIPAKVWEQKPSMNPFKKS